LATLLADSGVKYVFTGHLHANDITSSRSLKGNVIYDIQTGALITAPCAYRTVTFSDSGVEIKSEYVKKIDTSYLDDGYSEKQLEMISSDFSAYAEKFFESGLCKWLNRYIGSAGKLGKLLKLSENSRAYKTLNDLLLNVGAALSLPVYDDGATPGLNDSLEEIAALGKSKIPESDHIMTYQVAAEIMGAFYHGDENADELKETKALLFSCVKAALAYSSARLVESGRTDDLDELVKAVSSSKLLKTNSSFNYNDRLIYPLVEKIVDVMTSGLTDDLCEPSDINVTLEPYGENDASTERYPITFIGKLIRFIKMLTSKIIIFK
nr:hypothetical protein [Clostridiales bacterium]